MARVIQIPTTAAAVDSEGVVSEEADQPAGEPDGPPEVADTADNSNIIKQS